MKTPQKAEIVDRRIQDFFWVHNVVIDDYAISDSAFRVYCVIVRLSDGTARKARGGQADVERTISDLMERAFIKSKDTFAAAVQQLKDVELVAVEPLFDDRGGQVGNRYAILPVRHARTGEKWRPEPRKTRGAKPVSDATPPLKITPPPSPENYASPPGEKLRLPPPQKSGPPLPYMSQDSFGQDSRREDSGGIAARADITAGETGGARAGVPLYIALYDASHSLWALLVGEGHSEIAVHAVRVEMQLEAEGGKVFRSPLKIARLKLQDRAATVAQTPTSSRASAPPGAAGGLKGLYESKLKGAALR